MSSNTNKPSVLLVPGACALPEFYDNFFAALHARGYEAEGVWLPSVALKTEPAPEGPPPTMYDDAARIAQRIEALADAGKDVVLVTHSYGGVPGTQCLKGLSKAERSKQQGKKGGVVRIAYMTSLVPAVGEAAAVVQQQAGIAESSPMEVDDKGWVHLSDLAKVAETTFSHMPPEEGLRWANRMQTHSAASFGDPLTHAGYKDLPVSYLLCEEDQVIPASVQRAGIEIVERVSERKVDVTTLKTGHAPTATAAKETEEWMFGVLESC